MKCDEEIEDVQVSVVDVLQHVMSERESCYQIKMFCLIFIPADHQINISLILLSSNIKFSSEFQFLLTVVTDPNAERTQASRNDH